MVSAQKTVRKGSFTMVFVEENYRFSENLLFSALVAGVQMTAEKMGYDVSVQYLSEKRLREYQPRADGTIFLGTMMTEGDLRFLSDAAYPLVVLDRDADVYPVNSVAIDNACGVRMGLQHLVENGHTAIGYLHCLGSVIYNYVERFEAYRNNLDRFHIENAEILELPGDMTRACSVVSQWLDKNSFRATALLCDNDQIACGAITALNARGIRVGKDISVICFDNSLYAQNANLTTIDIPFLQMGREAVMRLLDQLENPQGTFVHSRIGTDLIVRGSVDTRE